MSSHKDELDLLFNGLADGELSEADETRLADVLRADASARRRYRQFMMLHASLMWDYAAGAPGIAESEEALPSSKVVRLFSWRGASAIAAAIAICAAFAVFWTRDRGPSPVPIARLETAAGAVSWSDDSGQQHAGLAAGASLAAGTLVVEDETGSAQLRFRDGSILTLTGDAELGFSDDGQKRLVLRRGAFSAHVAPQRPGKPMVVRTATAEIEVIGTVFALAAEQNQTALNVESGSVRLRRLVDGQAVDVTAKHLAIASLDVRTEMRNGQQSVPPNDWRRTFDAPPPASCKGAWLGASGDFPGRFRALPFVAGRRAGGHLVIHHGISVRAATDEAAGLVSLTIRSRLHVRYRTERRTGLKLFLSCEQEEGIFGGNFEYALDAANSAPDGNGWLVADVPIFPLEPVTPEQHPFADGLRVRALILHSYESDMGLEVAEIGISEPQ